MKHRERTGREQQWTPTGAGYRNAQEGHRVYQLEEYLSPDPAPGDTQLPVGRERSESGNNRQGERREPASDSPATAHRIFVMQPVFRKPLRDVEFQSYSSQHGT